MRSLRLSSGIYIYIYMDLKEWNNLEELGHWNACMFAAGCVSGPYQSLHTSHCAVGMPQRVSEPVHSIAGLSVPVETDSNAGAVEGQRQSGHEEEAEEENGSQ